MPNAKAAESRAASLGSAFVYADLEPHEAAILAARANRMAGKVAQVTPATRVKQVIDHFPPVFKEHLCQWSGACYTKGEGKDG